MDLEALEGILEFLRESERLKTTYRAGYTSNGRVESVAEHTWRLCLMALVLERHFPDVDMGQVIKICIVHDLGEALNGDIPAPDQHKTPDKSVNERRDLLQIARTLPENLRNDLLELWDEYENATTPEARTAKALDKLETIMQHNQGKNPVDFDYTYNLTYGNVHTQGHPVLEVLRALLDEETRRRAESESPKKSGD